MKKYQISPLVPVAIGWLTGTMLCYCLTLFLLAMTYRKQLTTVAGKDYVSEETRWSGHIHVRHLPVYYGK